MGVRRARGSGGNGGRLQVARAPGRLLGARSGIGSGNGGGSGGGSDRVYLPHPLPVGPPAPPLRIRARDINVPDGVRHVVPVELPYRLDGRGGGGIGCCGRQTRRWPPRRSRLRW